MLFPVVECDDVVQVGDKFRVLGSKTYKTPDEADWTLIEIDIDGAGFIDVTGDLTKPYPEKKWFLDWQVGTAGSKIVTLRVTAGVSPVTVTKTIEALTAADDNLFSSDDQIKEIQEDVLSLLPDGKSSFKYKHRAAQKFILDWLWNNAYHKIVGSGVQRFEKEDVIDVQYISDWSAYVTLRMIYQSASNQNNDIFQRKAGEFQNFEERAREKFLIKLDVDGDASLSENEGIQVTSRRLYRV